jgi:transcriptional regulator with AAA-type ATPase domain
MTSRTTGEGMRDRGGRSEASEARVSADGAEAAGTEVGLRDTLKYQSPEREAARAMVDVGPLLVRLICAHDVPRMSARYFLDGMREVAIGRTRERRDPGASGFLSIAIGDPYVSSRHARLVREGARWFALDEGSMNGTFVGGQRLAEGERRALGDEALIDLGGTFFLFRASALGLADGDRSPATGVAELREPSTLNPAWEAEMGKLELLARTRHELLLEGESGAGKEVLARWIHERSGRRGRMVSLNCAALTETLVEDELFGHVRGAFSDAQSSRVGLFRAAREGTLFLDEIGDMPMATQAKLLRVLEDRMVRPIGSEQDVEVDVRFIAATHRDLQERVEEGKFRHDLLARLGLLRFRVPPLRERREDLGLLIRSILREAAPVRFELEALRLLLLHPWPMNVRELRRILLAAVDLAPAGADGTRLIAVKHLSLRRPDAQASSGAARAPARVLSAADLEQRDQIGAMLRSHGGNVAAAARAMGVPRTRLQRLMARLGVDRSGREEEPGPESDGSDGEEP